ncbi:alanine racemase, partial [bacterium]|nr:alanine racemase [bacterium]
MTLPALGRPTWVTVDLSALQWNFRQVRRLVGSSVKILAIVKANAYGHGAVECSRALVAAGADTLGVATVAEGIELRKAGVRLPIVVLGFTQNCEAGQVLRWRLESTIGS